MFEIESESNHILPRRHDSLFTYLQRRLTQLEKMNNHHRLRKNPAALLLSAAFCWSLAAALESNEKEQPQSLTETICEGRPRPNCEVELDVPAACATDGSGIDPSCPIVFFLHGSGGTNNWFARTSGVHDANMIGVYPQGEGGWNTGPKDSNVCAWDDFECIEDPDEGDFIANIIDNIRSLGGTGNVYAYGNSNGAALAHRLASNGGTQLPIKGIIVSVTQLLASPERSGPGSLNYNQPSSSRGTPPVSILSIMGTADGLIPYEGGSSAVFNGAEEFELMGSIESMLTWAQHNGCSGAFQTSEHTTDTGDGTATKYDYTNGCPEGIYVEHYAIHGGGHGAGGTRVDGAKIDVLEFVSKVEGGGGGSPPPPTPTSYPTDASGCTNDANWSGKFNAAHTCDYVAQNPDGRCFFEDSDGVTASIACPEVCDPNCESPVVSPVAPPPSTPTDFPTNAGGCEDDPNWSGKFNTAHGCAYVAENPGIRCNWENNDGLKANVACPMACDTC